MEPSKRGREKTGRDDFLWHDWWFGVYRRGFGPSLEITPHDRSEAQRRGLLVAASLVPLFILLFVAIDWRPDAGQAHYDRAGWAFARGDYETGIRELKTAVERSPGCLRYRIRLVVESVKYRMLAEAAKALSNIIPSKPGFVGLVIVGGFLSYYGSVVLSLYWRARAIRNSRPRSGL